MTEVSKWFDEALAISDSVERSQTMCDLVFGAERMMHEGRRSEAIELFELLATLDRLDDLLLPAIESADQHLVSLGVRKTRSLNTIVDELHKQFCAMPERERLLAVA